MYKKYLIAILGIVFLFGCNQNVNSDIYPNQQGESNQKAAVEHFDIEIAKIINNQIVLSSNIDSLVSNWEDIINSNSQLNVDFETVNIEIDDGDYYIVGVDESALSVSMVKLVLDGDVFYEVKYPGVSPSSPGQGWSCTCSGCTSTGTGSAGECSPKQNEDGWYCTDCSEGTCTKTEVAGTSGIMQ